MAGPTAASALTHDLGWVSRIRDPGAPERVGSALIGALPGEGVGPEVVQAALDVLARVEEAGGRRGAGGTGGSLGLAGQRGARAPLAASGARVSGGGVAARGGGAPR